MGEPGPGERRPTLLLTVADGPPVPLLFWEAPDATYLVATGRPAWLRALEAPDGVRVQRPGSAPVRREAHRVLAADEGARVEAGFRAKYGPTVWDRHFAGERVVVRLDARRTTASGGPYERVQAEFDQAAAWYTERIEADPVERELRVRSRAWLTGLFRGSDPLLEIGPGTGLETLPILAAGHRVAALDLSPGMLERLEARVRSAGLADRFEGRPGRLATVGEDLSAVPAGAFAGAYSTFGAFNLEPSLRTAGEGLRRLLRPGATLAVGTLSPSGLAPLGYAALRGDGRELRARLAYPIPAGTTRYGLDVFPRGPRTLARALGPAFRLRRVRAASVLLPPNDHPRLRRLLGPTGWDRWIGLDRTLRRGPGAGWIAEWSFVELVRSSVP